jgi:Papain-like cysteine protease AvrRpt2
MHYGLLWTSHGWLVMTPDGMTVQRAAHIIIFYGIDGDGTPGGTQIKYVDPSEGAFISRMVQQHETGTMQSLTDRQLRPVLADRALLTVHRIKDAHHFGYGHFTDLGTCLTSVRKVHQSRR